MIPLASDLLPFPGADAVGRPFGVRQSPNRLFFIGPQCDCGPHSIGSVPEVVVIAVDNIAKRCKQATESLSSDRSRENAEEPATRAIAIIRSDRCRFGCCGQRRNLAFGAARNKGSWDRPL